ncbi:preprotein translocase subunit YajC [Leifsonia sp. Root227]|uniref:preprotein translocase subunit YajC n=1 Tax=unclassified Leifsonia TaxID=2663824 RepID=UPI0006F75DD1|nr:preprotein translocase subunit YajC [Leifsonia sp. Root227]KRC51220.1 preprotein translocase subunit YajC [Leifsonia sp. Root227]
MPIDPLTIVMVVILAALIFFMFRNSRKRQKEQAETRSKMVPGAEVMTNFGLYGTLLSVNEDDNTALVETSPGTILKVHRQVLARVVEPTVAEPISAEISSTEPQINEDHAIPLSEPEFGERVDDASKKPGSKSDD